jgi:hypothetical protein
LALVGLFQGALGAFGFAGNGSFTGFFALFLFRFRAERRSGQAQDNQGRNTGEDQFCILHICLFCSGFNWDLFKTRLSELLFKRKQILGYIEIITSHEPSPPGLLYRPFLRF